MKDIFFLAVRYLRFHKIKTVILVFCITIAIYLPLAVSLLVGDYQRGLLARAEATPLIAGAQGSRLDLVLHALYFRGAPAHDLTMGDLNAINASGLAQGIPILSKHFVRGFPIVGTSLEYFDFRRLQVAQGGPLTHVGECLLGAVAAQKLGLKLGDKLTSDPDNVFDLAGSYPLNMHVKGILAPTGGPDDSGIFVDYKTEWVILGIMHGHQDVATAAPGMLISQGSNSVIASDALVPYQEVTPENMGLFHVHGDPATFPVSAIIVIPHDAKSAAILRGRYEDPKSTVQLLVPKEVVSGLLDLVFRVKRFFDAQSVLVGFAMALLIALVILLSTRLRKREMDTMFRIGCARGTIFWLQTVEIATVGLAGVALAGGLAFVTVTALSMSASAGPIPSRSISSTPSPGGAKKIVAVVNYPLWYFTHRIAGDHVDILFPVPKDEDPAFWKPTDRDIESYQHADLVLLNGADYEKWLLTAAMPVTGQVITSQSFADRYMKNGEVIVHSHGPQGLHSHGLIDFNTWMDPQQAALQAQSIHDALVALVPDAAKDFDANLRSLQADLADLDNTLAIASAHAVGKQPLLASHPVYHYAARRYGWDLQNVHWEPDEMPSEEEWTKFEDLYHRHPARLMIWEEDSLPAVAKRLRAMGIEPIAFETCANFPASGDYFTAMKANAKRLEEAAARLH